MIIQKLTSAHERRWRKRRLSSEVVLPQLTWKYLRTNSTNVFLHVTLLKVSSNRISSIKEDAASPTSLDLGGYNNNVTTEMIKDGRAIHGVVRLLKHDKIQKRQLSRYLLTDFVENIKQIEGLLGGMKLSKLIVLDMPPEQTMNSRMAADSILSFWKPQVAMRTVADWTIWPYSRAPMLFYKG